MQKNQVGHVVPAHRVDGIDEAHQADSVHEADYKGVISVFWNISNNHIANKISVDGLHGSSWVSANIFLFCLRIAGAPGGGLMVNLL